jgi:integrase
MLRLVKRKNRPTWYIQGTIRGKRYRESTGTDSRPHAEAILAKRQSEILDRETFGEKRTAIFAQAVELYLDQGGEARFLSPLLERWGTTRIADITPADVARAAHEIYPGCSPAYQVRALYTPLNAVLRSAAKGGLCELRVFEKPKVKKRAVVAADDEWLIKFLAHANQRCGAIVIFMSLTGARVTEACRLRWEDVNFATGFALLRLTKNGEPRQVKLARTVIDALLSLPRDGGLVFGYAQRWSVNQAIKRTCRRAGLPVLTSHSVGRHAFAKRLLDRGHSLKFVKEAGGWKSLRIVDEHYGHFERSHIDEGVAAADANLPPRVLPDAGNVVKLRR